MLPTLALPYLGYDSVHQQGLALEEKTRNNERLTSERLADDTERRVFELARECFRDPALIDVIATLRGPDRPDIDRRIRTALQGIVKRHPIGVALLLAQSDAVRFPLLKRPVPRPLASYVESESASSQPALRELLRQAVPGRASARAASDSGGDVNSRAAGERKPL